MFILKRKDVEISSIQHPKRDQKIPILHYQGQTFRLLSVFAADQAEEARSFWRDLADNQKKVCVLLEEAERHSVWGKVRLDQLGKSSGEEPQSSSRKIPPAFVQACLLLLQTVYLDVEDLLGNRQAKSFQKDITKMFKQWNFPKATSEQEINQLLTLDPLEAIQIPDWEEHHIITLLQELYRIGKEYFGNDSFAVGTQEIIQDLSPNDQKGFLAWLNQSPLGQMWQ